MNLFKESRFVYMDGGTVPDSGAEKREVVSPIELKMDTLMEKSNILVGSAEKKAEVAAALNDKMNQFFSGAKFKLTSLNGADIGKEIRSKLAAALSKNAIVEMEGKEVKFVDQTISMFFENVKKIVLEKYPKLGKIGNFNGLIELSVEVGEDGKMSVTLKPDEKLLEALNALDKVKTPEVAEAGSTAVDENGKPTVATAKPQEGSEAVLTSDIANNILKSSILNGIVVGTTYGGLRDTLVNQVRNIDARLKGMDAYKNIKAENDDLRREIFVNALLKNVEDLLSGLIYNADATDKYYKSDVLKRVKASFVLKVENGAFTVDMSDDFKTAYEAERVALESMPKGGEVAAVAELKKGTMGWVLKNFFGVNSDAKLLEIVRGDGVIKKLLGAICVASGGASFGWAKQSWVDGKKALENNAFTSKYVAVIENAAKSASTMVGKFDIGKLSNAVSKGSDDVLKMSTDAGEALYKVAFDGKGMKLGSAMELKDKVLKLVIGEDKSVEFPGAVADIVKDGVKLSSPVKTLSNGTFELKNLPEDTFIPDGVEFKVV